MQATAITDEFLTTTTAARLAERSAETIRHWANTGRLPVAVRLTSGLRLFRAEDVLRAAAVRPRADILGGGEVA